MVCHFQFSLLMLINGLQYETDIQLDDERNTVYGLKINLLRFGYEFPNFWRSFYAILDGIYLPHKYFFGNHLTISGYDFVILDIRINFLLLSGKGGYNILGKLDHGNGNLIKMYKVHITFEFHLKI